MIPREVEVSLSHFGAAAARTGVAATPANKERYSETRAALVAAIERAIEAAVQSDRRACFDKAGFTEEQIAEFKAIEGSSHD